MLEEGDNIRFLQHADMMQVLFSGSVPESVPESVRQGYIKHHKVNGRHTLHQQTAVVTPTPTLRSQPRPCPRYVVAQGRNPDPKCDAYTSLTLTLPPSPSASPSASASPSLQSTMQSSQELLRIFNPESLQKHRVLEPLLSKIQEAPSAVVGVEEAQGVLEATTVATTVATAEATLAAKDEKEPEVCFKPGSPPAPRYDLCSSRP